MKRRGDHKRCQARTAHEMGEEEGIGHPHNRRYTAQYRRKQGLVKDIWIGAGLLIIFMPLGLQLTMLLATTFVSLCILDETAD